MAGTLVADTLNIDSSGILLNNNTYKGICKAWVNFQGGGNGSYTNTAGTRNANFNVSSITVNAAADYTINFTTNMADTNFSVAGFCNYDPTNYYTGRYLSLVSTSQSSVRVQSNYDYNALQTCYTGMIMVLGN
jgi:hypothetical protein